MLVHMLALPAPLHHIETLCGLELKEGMPYGKDGIASNPEKLTCEACKLQAGQPTKLDSMTKLPTVQMLNVEGNEVQVSMSTAMAGVLARVFMEEIEAHSVKNYIELEIQCPTKTGSFEPILVTIKKPGGKSPHTLRMEAEQKLAKCVEALQRVHASTKNTDYVFPEVEILLDELAECCH